MTGKEQWEWEQFYARTLPISFRIAGRAASGLPDGFLLDGGTKRYEGWVEEIRSELEALEGAGPPSVDELWSVSEYEIRGAADWIDDMPATEDAIQTAKGDLLTALVALEMAEERLQEADQDD